MMKRAHTGRFVALALFAVASLVLALGPSTASPNVVRAHSPGGASLTALTVTAGGTAQTLSPAFSSTVYGYTTRVVNSVAQVTVAGTPDGDGTVAYRNTDGTALPDADTTAAGRQVALPAVGGMPIHVVVSHTDAGTTTTQTYAVLVIREGTVATDRAALMALYNSLGGANWRISTISDHNWGSEEPLGDWTGVTTHSNGRVRFLLLGENNMAGNLPGEVGNLDQMETLVLRDNPSLTGQLPASLGNLTNLTYLEMWGTQVSGPIPASLGNLASLERLYLWNNQLNGPIPASLGNLASLEELFLGYNQLSGPIPEELGNLASLTDMFLQHNQLSGPIPAALGNLAALEALSLSSNALTGQIPEELGNLASLETLNAGWNALSGPIPAALGSLTILERLGLTRNQLSGQIPAELGSLTSLTTLGLEHNQLSGVIPAELDSLTSLKGLALGGNQLSGAIPNLSSLTSLEGVTLNDNQLTGTIPAWLDSLTSLVRLDLSNNRLGGTIPNLSSLTSLERLFLSSNNLIGSVPASLDNLTSLQRLYLNDNQLSGTIPDLSSLAELRELSLRNNALTGPIPGTLGQFRYLWYLDLSSNLLSGDFPAALGNLGNVHAGTRLDFARFASNRVDDNGNTPSSTGCVPLLLRYLITAQDYTPYAPDPDLQVQNIPAQDFIADDANGDGDFDDAEDTPGLGLPFCMLGTPTFSDASLTPAFAPGTAAYTASVANAVATTTVTAPVASYFDSVFARERSFADTVSIKKGTTAYASGDAVPLDVGQNEITVTVTPVDATPTLTYTVAIFRAGVDKATLMALYDGTGGASWTDKTNWGSTEPLNDWFGVTADSNENVTDLDLSGNNLRGTLPAALGSLTSLTTLDLSANALSGTVPDLRAITKLQSLSLGDNQFSGTIPDWLGSLTELQSLSLRDNRLTGAVPAALGTLASLDFLYLSDNELSGAIPAALGSLTGLDAARFAGNAFTGCVPNGLRYLVSAQDVASLPAHDFLAVDANADGDTADDGDTPGLALPFCTLSALTFSDLFLRPTFATDTVVYTAGAVHAQTATTVTATANNPSDTVSVTKGTVTYMSGDAVPLDVGPNVVSIEVTPTDNTPTHTYTVTVTRVTNRPPTFDEGQDTTRGVDENTVAGADIGAPVAATDDENDTLTYSLDAAGAASFAIDASSGQLRAKADVDHETRSSYTVTVAVRDSKDANGSDDTATDDTIRVTVLVADLNEAPAFPATESGARSVAENTAAGDAIGAPVTADDAENDTLTYTLDTASRDTFAIVATTGQLQTKAALDYESETSHTVTVTARDPAGEEATITVTITVTNVDETGTVTLSSLQPQADTELTAALDDPDTVSGSVIWSWAWSPDGTTRWTTIGGASAATYTPVAGDVGGYLRVIAGYADGEGSGKTARAVSANSVQAAPPPLNTAPQFPMSESGARSVAENTVASQAIGAPVTADDAENDPLTYTLDTASKDTFAIVATTGQLQTKAALDYESGTSHTVTVTAGDPAGEVVTITVTITVTNVEEAGTVTLSSLQPQDQTALTAALEDPDVVSGSVTWSWERSSNGTSNWATISGETAATYTPVAGDVGYYLRATAAYADGEGSGKTARAVSANSVQAAPVASNTAPQFPMSESGARSVAENTVASQAIGAPVAADDAENDTLTYTLDATGSDTFAIVATTGQLQTKAALDYESGTSHTVTVTARDPAGADDTITVTITVTNVEEAGTVTLSSLQPQAETALTAALDDPDGVSGGVTWSWERSSDRTSNWTTISGETAATYTPVAGDVGDYLRATAAYTDGEGSGKTARAVSANRVQAAPPPPNTAPEFPISETGMRSVAENTAAGEAIGPPVAADDAENDTLTYTLDATGRDTFAIVATTGQLQTKAALDYESGTSHTVTVTARDPAGADDTITVTITVTNVEEAGTVTLSSLQPQAETALTAALDDPDGVSGGVTWSWERSSDRTSNWTTISGETAATYTPVAGDEGDYLRVTAAYTDGEGPEKTARAVTATPVEVATGRNKPVLREHPTATRSIPRNAPRGSNVGAPIMATDADNDLLFYSLGGVDAAFFVLDGSSGQLRNKEELTGIRRTTYRVRVSVSDGRDDLGNPETPPVTDTTTVVTITVTAGTISRDGNGGGGGGGGFGPAPTAPKFGDGFRTTRTLAHNALAGDPVGDPVAATHPDDLAITYTLSGADAARFTVDEDTGQIRVKDAVAFELGQTFTVNLTATDSAGFGAIIIVVIEVGESKFHRYDLNRNGVIEKNEVLRAIADYFAGRIEKPLVLEVVSLYFTG